MLSVLSVYPIAPIIIAKAINIPAKPSTVAEASVSYSVIHC